MAYLRLLHKILPLLPFQARQVIVQGLILSHLDYGNALYLGAPQSTVHKLQIIQNCAARTLLQIPRRHSIKPGLKNLHWLPVKERIQFKALCIAHKALWNTGPDICHSLISPHQPPRQLRSAAALLARVPKIKRARCGGRSFSYNSAKLWNSLSLPLRAEPNLLSFCKLLKTFLFN